MFTVHNRRVATQVLSRTRQYLSGLSLQGRFLLIIGASSLIITLLFWAMFNNFTEQLLERIGARFAVEQSLYDRARALQPLIRAMASANQSADNPLLRRWAANERDPVLYGQSMDELRNRFGNTNYYAANVKSGNFYYYDSARKRNGLLLRSTLNATDPDDA